MTSLASYLYGFRSSAALEACRRRIAEKRRRRLEMLLKAEERVPLSDEEQLALDMKRIGGDFERATRIVIHAK